MTNIQPNYCSFEQCKLLKEKGFVSKYKLSVQKFIKNARPEQWQVHEWIETNFKLYVDTKCINSTRGDNFEYSIHKNNDTIKIKNGFDSRRESYSAAFDYILNNLI